MRFLHRVYAALFGYFWLPCPLCGTMFGGHEWGDRDGHRAVIYRDPSIPTRGTGICPACTRAGLGERTLRV